MENPVCVLDQEESKKFLTGKPEDKYKFFTKATDLERIDVSVAATLDKLHDMHEAIRRQDHQMEPRRHDVATKKQRWERHQAVAALRDKVRETRAKLVWASYTEAVQYRDDAIRRHTDVQTKLDRKTDELAEFEQSLDDPGYNQEALQGRIQALLAEASEQVALKRQLDQSLRDALVPLRQAEAQRKRLTADLQIAKRELDGAKKQLQEYRDERVAREGSAESKRSELADQLRHNTHERDQCRERSDALRQAVGEALRAYEEVEPMVREAKARAHQASRRFDQAKDALRGLQEATDEFAVFGPKVKLVYDGVSHCSGRAPSATTSYSPSPGPLTRLSSSWQVERARRERKFRGPVLGPIGKFVKVAPGKEALAGLAELALGLNVLDRFIVTCDHDRLVLQDIRRRTGCTRECGIFEQPPSTRYDVGHPSVPGTETVATVLAVSEDLVFNCLGMLLTHPTRLAFAAQ